MKSQELTFGKLQEFFSGYNTYLDELKELEGNILVEGIEIISDDIQKAFKRFNFELKKIAAKYATKDPKTKVILTVGGQYQYTEEDTMSMQEAIDNLDYELSGITLPELDYDLIPFKDINIKIKFVLKKFFK
tara:strand:- start:2311 stop:2706 length:396 start_codon:yes stop_codon:yes gene_type:complete